MGENCMVYESVRGVSMKCQGNEPNRNLVTRQVSTKSPRQEFQDYLTAAYLPGHAVNCRWTITLVARDSGAHTDTILSIQWERAFELCKVSFIFPIANSWPFSTGQYTWPSNYIDRTNTQYEYYYLAGLQIIFDRNCNMYTECEGEGLENSWINEPTQ